MMAGAATFIPLVGVLIGAALAFLFGLLKDVQVNRRGRAALAAALYAEIQALVRQICYMARVIAENERIEGDWRGVPANNYLDSFYPYSIPDSLVYKACLSKIGDLGSEAAISVVLAFQRVEEARLGLRLYTDKDDNGDQIWTAAAVLQPAKQLVEMMPSLTASLTAITGQKVGAGDYDLGNTDQVLKTIGGKRVESHYKKG